MKLEKEQKKQISREKKRESNACDGGERRWKSRGAEADTR